MSQELRVLAIEFRQRHNSLYIFTLSASQLEKLVRSRPNTSSDKEGIQRVLNKKRVGEIAKYVSVSDAQFTPMPNSIVVNFKPEVRFEVIPGQPKGMGYLVFPDTEGYFGDILDGQHRLYGIVNENSKHPDLELAVTGVMLRDPSHAGKVFADINRLQTKAPPVLIVSIRLEIGDWPNEEESAAAIVERLNEDSDSPLKNKIQMHQDQKNRWITNDVAIKLVKDMIHPKNELSRVAKHLSTDTAVLLIKNYLKAAEEVFPDAWGHNKEFRLTRPAGIAIRLVP